MRFTTLRDAAREDIFTRAMADYFEPLMAWLEEQNKRRQIGWEGSARVSRAGERVLAIANFPSSITGK